MNNDNKLSTLEIKIFCRDNDLKYDTLTQKITFALGDYLEDDINNKLDTEKYSLASIKQRYPEDKYLVLEYGVGLIYVYDKTTDSKVLRVFEYKGTEITIYDDKDNEYTRKYDKNGDLVSYEKDGKFCSLIADDIYKAISAKKAKMIPTIDVNKLALTIKRINATNVKETLSYYESAYGQSLI